MFSVLLLVVGVLARDVSEHLVCYTVRVEVPGFEFHVFPFNSCMTLASYLSRLSFLKCKMENIISRSWGGYKDYDLLMHIKCLATMLGTQEMLNILYHYHHHQHACSILYIVGIQ